MNTLPVTLKVISFVWWRPAISPIDQSVLIPIDYLSLLQHTSYGHGCIRIENNTNKEEIFEAIEKTHPPLVLDSGATAHVRLEHTGPTEHRRQGNSEIWITEFDNKFKRLLSIGSLQQEQLADQFPPYQEQQAKYVLITAHHAVLESPQQIIALTRLILATDTYTYQ